MLRNRSITERWTPYLFLGPAVLLLIVLLIYPITRAIQYSVFEGVFLSPTPKFVGLKNFIRLFRNEGGFYPALLHTTSFTIVSVVSHVLLGLFFAMLLNKPMNGAANSVFKVLFMMPWLFTAPIIAFIWRIILAPPGVINSVVRLLGFQAQDWYGDPSLAMFSLMVTNAWRGYPYVMISFLAGLQSIPKSLYEAALVDGCTDRQKFWHVTLPLLRPIILSVALLDTIRTFRVFPIVWLTTGGGPMGRTEVLSTSIYRTAFYKLDYSLASAQSVVILVIVGIFSIFYIRRQGLSMD